MLTTLKNAFKMRELRKKILFTLAMLVVIRLGSQLPVPGVDRNYFANWFAAQTGDAFNFFDAFTGGSFENMSLFALNITPYITSSIIIQLLTVAIPALERLSKEGEEGRRKLTRITRYTGAGIGVAMSIGYYMVLRSWGVLTYNTGWQAVFSAVVIVLSFAAGSQLLTWMGEQIDDKGIGNGVSLLIFVGIISRWSSLINSVKGLLAEAADGKPQYYVFIPLIAILAIAAVVFVVVLTNGERRIPVQYAKRVVGRKMYGGQASHIPIKVNMSGVMPVIFASTLCSIPNMIGSLLQVKSSFWVAFFDVFNYNSVLYAVIYLLLILAFNYFYVAIQYNPVEIANNLRKNNGAIPGIRPGKPTSDFITKSLSKITLIGAVFLGIIAVLPIVLGNVTGVSIQLGGTSLLIVVGVALDTGRSMESYMLMRHHKGFLE